MQAETRANPLQIAHVIHYLCGYASNSNLVPDPLWSRSLRSAYESRWAIGVWRAMIIEVHVISSE
jgi:hypothetical protein